MTNLIALQSGTELVGDYRIERVLGAGGFGITYLAEEIALARKVTIKEYFPADFATRTDGVEAVPRSQDCTNDYRWGLDRFIEEAQTLAKFNHTNIVRVYRYFRANNTGYMVLHFEEGQSLKSWLKNLGRAPRQKELDAIVGPLLDALELIHKADFLHRDIAPDNIIIRKDGTPVLIDFGSARGEILAHSKTVSALVKPGYSPYEQYAETARQQGPWTDIYALAATLYHAIAGKRPADSPSRMVKDELVPARDAALSAYRPGFLNAIDQALSLTIENRPQSIAAWRKALLAQEPERPGWFARTRSKKAAAAHFAPTPQPVAAGPNQESKPAPSAPDAPSSRGSMLGFFEGLKKIVERTGDQAPAMAPEAAKLEPQPAPPAETVKLHSPPQNRIAKVFKKEASPNEAKIKKDLKKAEASGPKNAHPPKARRKQARPRPIRTSRGSSWRPVLFKLLIGVGVASAAVAIQEKVHRAESQGSGMITSSIKTAATPPPVVIKPTAELKGHEGPITAATFTNDGRAIVTAGADGSLRIWDALSGSPVRTIELGAPSTSLAVMGSHALTGHRNGEILLWDWEKAEKLAVFARNEAEIWSLTFTGRPDRFAASSHDWKVALWDTASPGGPVQVLDAHSSAAQAVAYISTPRGPLLASGGADKSVKLWNLDTLDRIRTYRGHRDFITALAFSPDGKLLASASLDGNIRLWSTSSSRLMRRLYGHRGRVSSLAFSPAGDVIASGSADGQLRIWDVNRGRTLRTIAGHTGAINAVAFSPDGERIVSAGDDATVRIWANPLLYAAAN